DSCQRKMRKIISWIPERAQQPRAPAEGIASTFRNWERFAGGRGGSKQQQQLLREATKKKRAEQFPWCRTSGRQRSRQAGFGQSYRCPQSAYCRTRTKEEKTPAASRGEGHEPGKPLRRRPRPGWLRRAARGCHANPA